MLKVAQVWNFLWYNKNKNISLFHFNRQSGGSYIESNIDDHVGLLAKIFEIKYLQNSYVNSWTNEITKCLNPCETVIKESFYNILASNLMHIKDTTHLGISTVDQSVEQALNPIVSFAKYTFCEKSRCILLPGNTIIHLYF